VVYAASLDIQSNRLSRYHVFARVACWETVPRNMSRSRPRDASVPARPRRTDRPGTHHGEPRRTARCHALAAVPSVPRFDLFFHQSHSVPGVTGVPGVAGVPGVTCVPGVARRARRDPACRAWRGVPGVTCVPDVTCVPGVTRLTNRGPAYHALPGVPGVARRARRDVTRVPSVACRTRRHQRTRIHRRTRRDPAYEE
jgi:integrin beta 8